MSDTPARYTILFEGPAWFGSCARACEYGLRRLGHHVIGVDDGRFFPAASSRVGKVLRRLCAPFGVREFNHEVIALAKRFCPDIFFAFKGSSVLSETVSKLRAMGVSTYNFYPDISPQVLWDPASIRAYDAVFLPKAHMVNEWHQRWRVRQCIPTIHGYDPEVHFPQILTDQERAMYGSDVAFIGAWLPAKERLLAELLRRAPDVDLRIWGSNWLTHGTSNTVRQRCVGYPAFGTAYAKIICASKINLALVREPFAGSNMGDTTTTRSFEIPAAGGFMLHERTMEIATLFEEGRECECFADPYELAEKVKYYLQHSAERERIARGGRERCVPAYTYDERMRECMQWHQDHGI